MSDTLILYGSEARGTAGKHSDVDILILLKEITPEIHQALSHFATEAMAKTDYEEELSVLRRTEAQWDLMKGTAYYEAVGREGVDLWP